MRTRLFANTPAPSTGHLHRAIRNFNLHVRGDAAFFALSVRSGAASEGWRLNSALQDIEHLSADLQARIVSAVIDAEVDQYDGDDRSRAQYAREAHDLVVAALRGTSKNDVADALATYGY